MVDEDVCGNHSGECVNIENQGYNCSCFPGYKNVEKWDEGITQCEDIDECEISEIDCRDDDECQRSPCPSDSVCRNGVGKYSCDCKQGLQIDNATNTCMDIDECDTDNYDCPQFEVCENGFGNYTCVCPSEGFFKNETTGECFDVDECANITCVGEFTRCQNEPGRFSCVCRNGFQKDPLTDVCIDIDECADETHDCNNQTGTTCQNYPSSYLCGKYF